MMSPPQRVGLGIVAFLYGEFATVPLFMLAVLFRFPSNWMALVHHPRFTLVYLITVASFEALTSAVTWFIFGSTLVALWRPENMRRQQRLCYACIFPLALLSPTLLAAALLHIHVRYPQMPLMNVPLFTETFCFMAVASAIGLYRYLKMSRKAEQLLAAGGEFTY